MGRFFAIPWVGRWLVCGGNFSVWWVGVFAGGFGENGVWVWCFCGQFVVDWLGKVDCGMSFFGRRFFCRESVEIAKIVQPVLAMQETVHSSLSKEHLGIMFL